MFTVRTRTLGTCLRGKLRWNVERWPTNAGTGKLFLAD